MPGAGRSLVVAGRGPVHPPDDFTARGGDRGPQRPGAEGGRIVCLAQDEVDLHRRHAAAH